MHQFWDGLFERGATRCFRFRVFVVVVGVVVVVVVVGVVVVVAAAVVVLGKGREGGVRCTASVPFHRPLLSGVGRRESTPPMCGVVTTARLCLSV